MLIAYVVEGILRETASDQHLFKHFRNGRMENLAFRSIEGYVRLGRIAKLLYLHGEIRASEFTPAARITHLVLHKSLHGVDLGRHQVIHVRLVSLIYEKHAYDSHADEDEARGHEQDRVDSRTEIVASEGVASPSTGKYLKEKRKSQEEV